MPLAGAAPLPTVSNQVKARPWHPIHVARSGCSTGSTKVSPSHWFDGLVERHGLREVTLDSATASDAAALPPLHRDPFDRVVVALARARQLLVITSDENIPKYAGISTRW